MSDFNRGMVRKSSKSCKAVVFVDCENVCPHDADFVISEIRRIVSTEGYRNPVIKLFGRFEQPSLSPWTRVAFSESVEIVNVCPISLKKDATDKQLLVDATCDIVSLMPELVVIVSSDCDFAPLVRLAKDYNSKVVGVGILTPVKAYKKIFDKFYMIDSRYRVKVNCSNVQDIKNFLEDYKHQPNKYIVTVNCPSNEWYLVSNLGKFFNRNIENFDTKTYYGYGSFSKLISALDNIVENNGRWAYREE